MNAFPRGRVIVVGESREKIHDATTVLAAHDFDSIAAPSEADIRQAIAATDHLFAGVTGGPSASTPSTG